MCGWWDAVHRASALIRNKHEFYNTSWIVCNSWHNQRKQFWNSAVSHRTYPPFIHSTPDRQLKVNTFVINWNGSLHIIKCFRKYHHDVRVDAGPILNSHCAFGGVVIWGILKCAHANRMGSGRMYQFNTQVYLIYTVFMLLWLINGVVVIERERVVHADSNMEW